MDRPWHGMEGVLVAFAAGAAIYRAWWHSLVRTPRPTMRTRLLYAGAMVGAAVVGVLVTDIRPGFLLFPIVVGGVTIIFVKVETCPHWGKVIVREGSLFKTARHCRWCGGPIDPW